MSKSLIPKLQAIKQRYNEVADLIIQPDVITDQKIWSAQQRIQRFRKNRESF
jgi:peptide chain release factor 1